MAVRALEDVIGILFFFVIVKVPPTPWSSSVILEDKVLHLIIFLLLILVPVAVQMQTDHLVGVLQSPRRAWDKPESFSCRILVTRANC